MLNGKIIHPDEPLAAAVTEAIRSGELAELTRLLRNNPDLASARIGDLDAASGCGLRSLLHVATDWPGHYPNVAATIAALAEAGADVNARFAGGAHTETPLHWAASSNDVAALDALIDAGADIEADGGVIGGGTPLADARAFRQLEAAFRLVERGARTTLNDAATLGLLDRIESFFAGGNQPSEAEVTLAFWGACHGGRLPCASYLLERGADLNWIPPWEKLTPLDAARRSGSEELADWLQSLGAKTAGRT
ncbi:ankyrin repeat domain-containing protein [Paenibacillus arenilitoris]|uniref:ankyrin repeat domain-containing protein n=1 Tax=Paenibacillus arenilitoris TaxID=2772299 RepID=UPI001CC24F12|nr:ankyrin repeat domain-containing protein [Paenibacillus arenilitoris]